MQRTDNALGDFLRARRDLVRPEGVGLHAQSRRRVPGLRREELALLAGVSIDYYVRLEQGRDRHPSQPVLDALARVLMLDDEAVAHLHALAQPAPPRKRRRTPEKVRPAVARLVEQWPGQPVLVIGRYMDVLAANALATALNPGFSAGTRLLRFIFLDDRARHVYADWPAIAAKAVATLRGSAGTDPDDPALTELVGELSLKSDDFRRLWARHDVREKTTGRKRFNTPHVGLISLDFEGFSVASSPGQTLIVYSAEPGSPDEQALKLLAAAVA